MHPSYAPWQCLPGLWKAVQLTCDMLLCVDDNHWSPVHVCVLMNKRLARCKLAGDHRGGDGALPVYWRSRGRWGGDWLTIEGAGQGGDADWAGWAFRWGDLPAENLQATIAGVMVPCLCIGGAEGGGMEIGWRLGSAD